MALLFDSETRRHAPADVRGHGRPGGVFYLQRASCSRRASAAQRPEEFAEAGGGVRDVELGQELPIGGADGDAVAG